MRSVNAIMNDKGKRARSDEGAGIVCDETIIHERRSSWPSRDISSHMSFGCRSESTAQTEREDEEREECVCSPYRPPRSDSADARRARKPRPKARAA